jgi:hypothetical protein
MTASGGGPVANIIAPEDEDRKIVEFKKRRPTPDGGVAGAAGADGKRSDEVPDGGHAGQILS